MSDNDHGLVRQQGANLDKLEVILAALEQVKANSGGHIDDDAIIAVSEYSGATQDQVRLAIKLKADSEKKGVTEKLRASYLTLAPEIRLFVAVGILGILCGLAHVLEQAAGVNKSYFLGVYSLGNTAQIFGMVKVLALTVALYAVSVARDARNAAIGGLLLGSAYFVSGELFAALFPGVSAFEAFYLVPAAAVGAAIAFGFNEFVKRNRRKFGMKDPQAERKELLRQLVEIQDKLRGGEQEVTFLSIDIVGSTQLKSLADTLSVEYTFTEYHQFVERVVHRFAGRVHSTAGDGVTAAFESPQQAFGAARTMQTSIPELNMFKNKIGSPIVLRCGIHTGKVNAPDAKDITTLNFAQVIDIAAHMQKACPAGGVATSEFAARKIPGADTSTLGEWFEEGSLKGFVWVPKTMSLTGANFSQ